MPLPTISVVIPNYNHGKYLPDCLEAIARQSVPALEIILIDDGSTDNSVEIIERQLVPKYPQLRFYRNDRNRGVLYTANRGIDLARGDFISSNAADDQVLPGYYEKTLKLLADHPKAAWCGTICQFHNIGTDLKYLYGTGIVDKPSFFPPEKIAELARQNKLIIFTSTMLFRREALQEMGNYTAELKWHGDWFIMFVTAFRYGGCFVPEVLTMFRVIPTSFSQKGMRRTKDQLEVLRHILAKIEEKEVSDVKPFFQDGAVLAPFGKEMLWALVSNKKYWKYLTFTYFRCALWWTVRIEAKKILPTWMAGLYFKYFNDSKRPARQNPA